MLRRGLLHRPATGANGSGVASIKHLCRQSAAPAPTPVRAAVQHRSVVPARFFASRSASASASTAAAPAAASGVTRGVAVAGSVVATLFGMSVAQQYETAHADSAPAVAATTPPVAAAAAAPALPVAAAAVLPPTESSVPAAAATAVSPTDLPVLTGKTKKRGGAGGARGGNNAAAPDAVKLDIPEVSDKAPGWRELTSGLNNLTQLPIHNGLDLKYMYAPLSPPTTQEEASRRHKDLQIQHHFQFGSPASKEDEPTAVYDLTAVVALPAGQLETKISEHSVHGSARLKPRSNVEANIDIGLTGDEQHPGQFSAETTYHGMGYTTGATYAYRQSALQLTYVQNIPFRHGSDASLGAEFGHVIENGNTELTFGGRLQNYPGKKKKRGGGGGGSDDGGVETWSGTFQPGPKYGILSYQRKMPSGYPINSPNGTTSSVVTFGSELHYNANEHVSLAFAGMGYELPGVFSTRSSVNTQYQVASVCEFNLGGINLGFNSSIDYNQNKYTMGMSLAAGAGP